jgi:hypothetical protein
VAFLRDGHFGGIILFSFCLEFANTDFTEEGGRCTFSRMKKAVAIGSHDLVARRKAKDGEDVLKTGMNEGGPETWFRRPFGYFWVAPKVTRCRNRGRAEQGKQLFLDICFGNAPHPLSLFDCQ